MIKRHRFDPNIDKNTEQTLLEKNGYLITSERIEININVYRYSRYELYSLSDVHEVYVSNNAMASRDFVKGFFLVSAFCFLCAVTVSLSNVLEPTGVFFSLFTMLFLGMLIWGLRTLISKSTYYVLIRVSAKGPHILPNVLTVFSSRDRAE
jgi:hypothetical protein